QSQSPASQLEGSPHEPLIVLAPGLGGSFHPACLSRDGTRETRGRNRGAVDTTPELTRPLPSRLSRSVPVFHRVHPRVAPGGSRTLTAGGESHPAPKTSTNCEKYRALRPL